MVLISMVIKNKTHEIKKKTIVTVDINIEDEINARINSRGGVFLPLLKKQPEISK